MGNRRFLTIACIFASMALLATSCEKELFWGGIGKSGRSNGVGIRVNTASSSSLFETKAGSTAKPSKVFTSEDGGLVIEEYVSDIDAEAPVTKGTEIKQTTASSGNFNVDGRQFNVMAYIDTLNSKKEKVHVNEFSIVTKYNGSNWNWDCAAKDAPCWRDSTRYHIWSYWPTDSDVTTSSRSSVSVPNWTSGVYNTLTFTHAVPKSLEAQQDLLFAYNEELRECKRDDKGNFPVDPVTKEPKYELKTGQTDYFNIKFYHALTAVKFELDPAAKIGIDVHSITLCYIDNGTKTIVKNNGLATTGTCTVSGSELGAAVIGTPGTGTAGVSWSNLGGKKPLHYEIPSDKSVRSGYTETGDGVLFMIPQTATNLSVIVEFSANGTTYYTRVIKIASVNWQAGKYYTYRLKPNFNMPGELLYFGTTGISVSKLMSTPAQKLWATDYSNTGIKKIGMIVDDYTWSGNSSGSINLSVCGSSVHQSNPDPSPFQYDFLPVTSIPTTGTASEVTNKIYTFGDGTKESGYDTYYTYLSTSTHGARHFVFDVEDINPFNIQVYNASGNNGATFTTNVRCVVVLEIEEDDTVPVDFTGFDWSTI